MFFALLAASLAVSLAVCIVLARIFRRPVERILDRLISEPIHLEWARYLRFALYVVGVSGGVQVWKLERYISAEGAEQKVLELTPESWVLEIYRTVIGTMQGVAWMLLVFFLAALIAFVIVKGRESKRQAHTGQTD
jgi:large-conductance mechanosensitive channel